MRIAGGVAFEKCMNYTSGESLLVPCQFGVTRRYGYYAMIITERLAAIAMPRTLQMARFHNPGRA
jgi:hypothetical protein